MQISSLTFLVALILAVMASNSGSSAWGAGNSPSPYPSGYDEDPNAQVGGEYIPIIMVACERLHQVSHKNCSDLEFMLDYNVKVWGDPTDAEVDFSHKPRGHMDDYIAFHVKLPEVVRVSPDSRRRP